MKVNFDKEGINTIIDKITYDACGISETEPGRFDKVIKMSFNGVQLHVPCCADNANAIEFMLKDTLSKYIGVITGFYRWLDDICQTEMIWSSKTIQANKSFLYGQIYSYEYRYLVDGEISAYLLAVYSSGSKGGTAYTINYARFKERQIIMIDPVTLTISTPE